MSRYNPPTRPEHIDSLIQGVDRYNPNNLTLLHEYVEDQFKGEYEWDCMAALAVLKLYQFNPTTFNYPIAISLLAKSLHAIPTPDFNLCLNLLGEAPVSIVQDKPSTSQADPAAAQEGQGEDGTPQPQASSSTSTVSTASQPSAGILTDPTIVKLHQLAMLLASSRYPTFWTTYRSEDFEDVRNQVLEEIVDFENGVRKVVLNGTAGAFKSISSERLARYLGLDASDLEEFLSSPHAPGWTLKGNVVEVPVNKDNVVKSTGVTREEVEIADLSRLIQQAASTSMPAIRA